MTDHGKESEYVCPLAAVDRRLEDTHRLWHQAEENYFDPEAFRRAIQGTIQTLRTVTFILQNHKHAIPDFDDWYGAWQQRLRDDPLMRWMVDARNKIEKQGDLEAQSFVRAEIIASYLDEGPGIEVAADLFDDPGILLRRVPEGPEREHILKNGVLRIRRRWVENSLPDYELLDALAIAYGKITELVHDAHRQMGLPSPKTVNANTMDKFNRADTEWRMPCMIGHEDFRALFVSLKDGTHLELAKKSIHLDENDVSEVKERYGTTVLDVMKEEYQNKEKMAESYFNLVKSVFLRDGYHLPFLFLFRNRKIINMFPAPADDQQQKYLLMRQLAHEVTRHGADAAIFVNEVWFAPVSELAPYQRASESESRREALTLTLVSREGEPLQFSAEIVRNGDTATLAETDVFRGGAAFFFAPFYNAWGRPIPDEWLQAGAAVARGSGTRSDGR